MNGPIMRNKHKGAISELRACTWLLDNGFEVFRNVSQHGIADLVAWKPRSNEFIAVDVKTVNTAISNRVDGTIVLCYLYNKAIADGITLLYVYSDGEISWSKRENAILTRGTRFGAY